MTLLAGFARSVITPPIPCPVCGFTRRELAKTILDPLFVSATVICDQKNTVAWAACDVLGLGADSVARIRNSVAEVAPAINHVIVTATHTHTAPLTRYYNSTYGTLDTSYLDILEKQVVSAILTASQQMAAVTVEAGLGESHIAVNRRQSVDGRIVLGQNPQGLNDQRVLTLLFRHIQAEESNEPGCLHGALLWFTAHPIVSAGAPFVSRDYPGRTTDFLESVLKTDVVMFANGPTGNVNPYRDKSRPRSLDMDRVGLTLGADALKAALQCRTIEQPSLAVRTEWVGLPYRALPTVSELQQLVIKREAAIKYEAEQGYLPVLGGDITLNWLKAALHEWEQNDSAGDPTKVSIEVTTLTLGELAFVFIPAEVFVEVSEAIRRDSPYENTFIVSYGNGYIGYLPHEAAFAEGGYEVKQSHLMLGLRVLEPNAAESVVAAARRLLSL